MKQTFDLQQLALLNSAMGRSERLVADSFHIPALPSFRYPYELATLSDLESHERAADALAHLMIYERQLKKGIEHLYRICLQDDLILERARDLRQDWFLSLLLYILTHELVHVVRFQRREQSYQLTESARHEEEVRVHQITKELLAKEKVPGLESISESISDFYG